MAKVAAGQPAQARRDFLAISQSLDAPEQAQTRARAMMAAIDSGAAAQIPAVLRATPAAVPSAAVPSAAVPPAAAAPPARGAAPTSVPAAPAPSTAQ